MAPLEALSYLISPSRNNVDTQTHTPVTPSLSKLKGYGMVWYGKRGPGHGRFFSSRFIGK